MLTILGRSDGHRGGFCDGLARRNFLKVGGMAMGGIALSDVLRADAAARTGSSHKAIINIYLPGGPSHIDLWDPKPEAPREIRGEFQPIKTNVPGIEMWQREVTIGEGGTVKGSIVADRATLLGSVDGEIKADQIVIAKTAKVVGDIIHRSLSVEAGAILDGHCRRFDAIKETKRENAKIAPLKPTQPGGVIPNTQPKTENKPATG